MSEDLTEKLSEGPTPFEYVPPPKTLGWFRWFLSKLPGFCSYCGKRYVKAWSGPDSVSLFHPLGHSGRACPDSHEGYEDRFYFCGATVRYWCDNVKARENAN